MINLGVGNPNLLKYQVEAKTIRYVKWINATQFKNIFYAVNSECVLAKATIFTRTFRRYILTCLYVCQFIIFRELAHCIKHSSRTPKNSRVI